MSRFFVKQECWQHWPKTIIVGKNTDNGAEYRRYVPDKGTCRDLGDGQMFICSECGCTLDIQDENGEQTMMVDGVADVPKCCPNCKREVVDE